MEEDIHTKFDIEEMKFLRREIEILQTKVVLIEGELMREKRKTSLFLWCFFILILVYIVTYVLPKLIGCL